MRVSTKRVLSIGIAGIFFIATLVVYGQYISGYMSDVNAKRAIIASKESLYANQNSAVKQVQSTIEQFKNFQDIQKKLGLAIPNGIQTIQALRQIEAVAVRTSSTINSINFKTTTSRASKEVFLKKISVLEVSLGVSGTYDGLKNFLSLIETNARVANVQGFKFQPSSQGKVGSDTLTVKLEMYYQEI